MAQQDQEILQELKFQVLSTLVEQLSLDADSVFDLVDNYFS
jgi:hypothetical protein